MPDNAHPRERDCRKPGWKPGSEVVLADGQVWHFPRPRLSFRLCVDAASGIPTLKTDASAQGATYAQLIDRLDTAAETGVWFELVTALALQLLNENYHIPPEAVPHLFALDPASAISINRWRVLGRLVKGVGAYPKP